MQDLDLCCVTVVYWIRIECDNSSLYVTDVTSFEKNYGWLNCFIIIFNACNKDILLCSLDAFMQNVSELQSLANELMFELPNIKLE